MHNIYPCSSFEIRLWTTGFKMHSCRRCVVCPSWTMAAQKAIMQASVSQTSGSQLAKIVQVFIKYTRYTLQGCGSIFFSSAKCPIYFFFNKLALRSNPDLFFLRVVWSGFVDSVGSCTRIRLHQDCGSRSGVFFYSTGLFRFFRI